MVLLMWILVIGVFIYKSFKPESWSKWDYRAMAGVALYILTIQFGLLLEASRI